MHAATILPFPVVAFEIASGIDEHALRLLSALAPIFNPAPAAELKPTPAVKPAPFLTSDQPDVSVPVALATKSSYEF